METHVTLHRIYLENDQREKVVECVITCARDRSSQELFLIETRIRGVYSKHYSAVTFCRGSAIAIGKGICEYLKCYAHTGEIRETLTFRKTVKRVRRDTAARQSGKAGSGRANRTDNREPTHVISH